MRIRHSIAVAGAATLVACSGADTAPPAAAGPIAVFDAAALEIDAHYSFFEWYGIDWPSIASAQRARLSSSTTDAELFSVLCHVVDTLRSRHGALTSPTNTCAPSGPPYAANVSAALLGVMLPNPRVTPEAHLRFGVVGGDVGYVQVPSFVGTRWGDEMDQVLDGVGDVRGLVIDIRSNGGGDDANAAAIASRIVTSARTYQLARIRSGPGHADFGPPIPQTIAPAGRRHTVGPVALLTNRYVGSAAEDFVAMLRGEPAVFTVGDTTMGNSSNPLWRDLPNGWRLRIPQSMQTTPDGFNAEGRGYPPDLPVMLDPRDAERGVDTIVQRAVDEVRRRAGATADRLSGH